MPFQALVETAIEGIALVTLRGDLRYANPRFAQMFGCRPDGLTGLNLVKLLDAPRRQVVRDASTRRRAGLADGYELDIRMANGACATSTFGERPCATPTAPSSDRSSWFTTTRHAGKPRTS